MIGGFSRFIVRTFFREINVEGRENLPQGVAVIFTPNHPNSLLDPLLMFLFEPQYCIRFVAKAPLFRIPVFGWILRKIGSIPVVRKFEADGEIDYSAFFESCVQALQKGESVVIFPEGRSLPQPFLAPLKTGPARLFFLAAARGVYPKIVPVGLNYERGATFRSCVQISIAPPIATNTLEPQGKKNLRLAVQALTEEIRGKLDAAVFQAQDYRDRELMLLLDRLYSEDQTGSWPERLPRVKRFEVSLERLRSAYPREIENLRRLLVRYERLSVRFGIDPTQNAGTQRSFKLLLQQLTGFCLAALGSIINWLPYQLVDLLTRKKDQADAATFKIVYSLFLFPAFYFLEAAAVKYIFGWISALFFLAALVPLSLFTLRFFEWRDGMAGSSGKGSLWFDPHAAQRVSDQLSRLRSRIVSEVDALASRPELRE